MPKLSVVILNHNGNDIVLRCLRSILTLAWTNAEIVVVDNASTDESPDHIEREFGDRVRLIRRQLNSPTAGRNEGFRVARGEYVLSLDNDIMVADAMIPLKAVAILEQCPRVGALAFKICSLDRPDEPLAEHWWHPIGLHKGKNRFFYTDWFAEGAVLFRSSALSVTGGYDDDLFHGFECVDLALRLMDQGFEILYCPNLTCAEIRVRGWHHVTRNQINYLTLRNKLWTVWKDYPLRRGLLYASTRIVTGGIQAMRHGWIDLWLRAVSQGIAAPQVIRDKRHPISAMTWKRIRRLRKGQYCAKAERTAGICISSRTPSHVVTMDLEA